MRINKQLRSYIDRLLRDGELTLPAKDVNSVIDIFKHTLTIKVVYRGMEFNTIETVRSLCTEPTRSDERALFTIRAREKTALQLFNRTGKANGLSARQIEFINFLSAYRVLSTELIQGFFVLHPKVINGKERLLPTFYTDDSTHDLSTWFDLDKDGVTYKAVYTPGIPELAKVDARAVLAHLDVASVTITSIITA